MAIYIHKNNRQLGPFEESKILEMLGSGQISPDDMAIRSGESQWQPLKIFYPNAKFAANFQPLTNNRQPPPTAPKKGNSKLVFALLGIGGFFLLAVVAVGAFIYTSRSSNKRNGDSTALDVKINNPAAPPVVDEKKQKELADKKIELAKLSPPLKLDPNWTIKGKIFFAGNLNYDDEAAIKSGFSTDRLAKTADEIKTLIQANCTKGKFVGSYEKGVKAFASECKVSLIDLQTSVVVAQKTFSNGEIYSSIPEKDVFNKEYLVPRPVGAMQRYLDNFALDKPLPDAPRLDEKELTKIAFPVNLNANAPIKGKIKIVEKYLEGTDEIVFKSSTTYQSSSDYGLPFEKFTFEPQELETLIRIVCAKGERIGKVGNTTEYSNRCEVSLIDYKTQSVFAQKTFENKTPQPKVRNEKFPLDSIVGVPRQEIKDYLKSFPLS